MNKIEAVTIKPEDIDWAMHWSEDESKKYNVPVEEDMFEADFALAYLLAKEVIFLNSHWWRDDFPEEAQKLTSLNVNVNDCFAYACADAEPVFYDQLEDLWKYYKRDTSYGVVVWAAIQRKELPIPPVLNRCLSQGWTMEDFVGCEDNGYMKHLAKLAEAKRIAEESKPK